MSSSPIPPPPDVERRGPAAEQLALADRFGLDIVEVEKLASLGFEGEALQAELAEIARRRDAELLAQFTDPDSRARMQRFLDRAQGREPAPHPPEEDTAAAPGRARPSSRVGETAAALVEDMLSEEPDITPGVDLRLTARFAPSSASKPPGRVYPASVARRRRLERQKAAEEDHRNGRTRPRASDGVAQQPVSRSPWWLRMGTHRQDVRRWLLMGHRSPDAMERAVVAALKRAVYIKGDDGTWHYSPKLGRHLYGALCLAYVLWFDQRRTSRKAMRGVVVGKPRGALARLVARDHDGEPCDPRTVSTWVTQLAGCKACRSPELPSCGTCEPILAGLLLAHQASPEDAVEHDLPHAVSMTRQARGGATVQAFSIYWWRVPKWLSQTTTGQDLSSRYVEPLGYTGNSVPLAAVGGSAVSRAGPRAEHPAPAAPHTKRGGPP